MSASIIYRTTSEKIESIVTSFPPNIGWWGHHARPDVGVVLTFGVNESETGKRVLDQMESGLTPEEAVTTVLHSPSLWFQRQIVAIPFEGEPYINNGFGHTPHTGSRSLSLPNGDIVISACNLMIDAHVPSRILAAWSRSTAPDFLSQAIEAFKKGPTDRRGLHSAGYLEVERGKEGYRFVDWDLTDPLGRIATSTTGPKPTKRPRNATDPAMDELGNLVRNETFETVDIDTAVHAIRRARDLSPWPLVGTAEYHLCSFLFSRYDDLVKQGVQHRAARALEHLADNYPAWFELARIAPDFGGKHRELAQQAIDDLTRHMTSRQWTTIPYRTPQRPKPTRTFAIPTTHTLDEVHLTPHLLREGTGDVLRMVVDGAGMRWVSFGTTSDGRQLPNQGSLSPDSKMSCASMAEGLLAMTYMHAAGKALYVANDHQVADLETALGTTYGEYVRKVFLEPLGMTATRLPNDPTAPPSVIETTPTDLAKYLRFLMFGNRSIMADATFKLLFQSSVRGLPPILGGFEQFKNRELLPSVAITQNWLYPVSYTTTPELQRSTTLRPFFVIDPAEQRAVVVVSAGRVSDQELINTAGSYAHNLHIAHKPANHRELTTEIRQAKRLVGTYISNAGQRIVIGPLADRLIAFQSTDPYNVLAPDLHTLQIDGKRIQMGDHHLSAHFGDTPFATAISVKTAPSRLELFHATSSCLLRSPSREVAMTLSTTPRGIENS